MRIRIVDGLFRVKDIGLSEYHIDNQEQFEELIKMTY